MIWFIWYRLTNFHARRADIKRRLPLPQNLEVNEVLIARGKTEETNHGL